jgi:hypothetical protein
MVTLEYKFGPLRYGSSVERIFGVGHPRVDCTQRPDPHTY